MTQQDAHTDGHHQWPPWKRQIIRGSDEDHDESACNGWDEKSIQGKLVFNLAAIVPTRVTLAPGNDHILTGVDPYGLSLSWHCPAPAWLNHTGRQSGPDYEALLRAPPAYWSRLSPVVPATLLLCSKMLFNFLFPFETGLLFEQVFVDV